MCAGVRAATTATRRTSAVAPGGHLQRYKGKISRPLLDRIDLNVEAPVGGAGSLPGTDGQANRGDFVGDARAGSRGPSDAVDARVDQREHAARRLRENYPLDDAAEKTLEMAVRRLALSPRAHDRILKVSRTIADLGGNEQIQAEHIAEAVQYLSLDREYWK
jgi:magnesium chelatase family protein